MALFPTRITADTTKVTADRTGNRPTAMMAARLRALLPPWAADEAPRLEGLLAGIGKPLAFARAFAVYAQLQTRVATSTGGFLDLTARDYFRNRIQRRRAEADRDYQLRIRREVLRPRATRSALVRVVTEMTGTAPDVWEAFNPGDCGGYEAGTFAYAGEDAPEQRVSGYEAAFGGYSLDGSEGGGTFAYVLPTTPFAGSGGAGSWGSLELANQIFLRVHRPAAVYAAEIGVAGYGAGTFCYGGGTAGKPALGGYGSPLSGYDMGAACYDLPGPPYEAFTGAGYYIAADLQASVTDTEIYAAIAEATPAGVIAWTAIQGQ